MNSSFMIIMVLPINRVLLVHSICYSFIALLQTNSHTHTHTQTNTSSPLLFTFDKQTSIPPYIFSNHLLRFFFLHEQIDCCAGAACSCTLKRSSKRPVPKNLFTQPPFRHTQAQSKSFRTTGRNP
jgi:hypothetical protein